VNLTVDASILEYYPFFLLSGKHYLRIEFFTEKMETIFYFKIFFINKPKSNTGLLPHEMTWSNIIYRQDIVNWKKIAELIFV
jgi:hypothetical protein